MALGKRVRVIGRLEYQTWNDKATGEPRLQHRVQADDDAAGGLLGPHAPDELAELDHRSSVEWAEQLEWVVRFLRQRPIPHNAP